MDAGETVQEALEPEALEEACAEIAVGQLLLVTEYEPKRNAELMHQAITLGLFFACTLNNGCIPRLPAKPDPYQIGVEWVALEQLPNTPLLAQIAAQLLAANQDNHARISLICI